MQKNILRTSLLIGLMAFSSPFVAQAGNFDEDQNAAFEKSLEEENASAEREAAASAQIEARHGLKSQQARFQKTKREAESNIGRLNAETANFRRSQLEKEAEIKRLGDRIKKYEQEEKSAYAKRQIMETKSELAGSKRAQQAELLEQSRERRNQAVNAMNDAKQTLSAQQNELAGVQADLKQSRASEKKSVAAQAQAQQKLMAFKKKSLASMREMQSEIRRLNKKTESLEALTEKQSQEYSNLTSEESRLRSELAQARSRNKSAALEQRLIQKKNDRIKQSLRQTRKNLASAR